MEFKNKPNTIQAPKIHLPSALKSIAPVIIKWKKLTEDAKLPKIASAEAACFDFYAQRIEQPTPDTAIIYFGLATEFPDGFVLTIQPRSSFCLQGWVQQNSPGQVDSDYRGELQMRLQAIPNGIGTTKDWIGPHYTLTYPKLPYEVGDRVAQGKLEIAIRTIHNEATELNDTERGTGGFGSTGKQ